jgi:UDP-N-acetylglucosamine transferase subunit ALG13
MIFVTVGTHTQSFNRLLEEVDMLIENNKIKEKVIMQIGHSTYKPKNAEWFRFTDFNNLRKIQKTARVIITHGGAGCIIDALSNKKPVIAVPRFKKFNEHVNDHQLDLVKALAEHKKIYPVYDINKLEIAIKKIRKIERLKSTKKSLCKEIERTLINFSI